MLRPERSSQRRDERAEVRGVEDAGPHFVAGWRGHRAVRAVARRGEQLPDVSRGQAALVERAPRDAAAHARAAPEPRLSFQRVARGYQTEPERRLRGETAVDAKSSFDGAFGNARALRCARRMSIA